MHVKIITTLKCNLLQSTGIAAERRHGKEWRKEEREKGGRLGWKREGRREGKIEKGSGRGRKECEGGRDEMRVTEGKR